MLMAVNIETALQERATDWRALSIFKRWEGSGYDLSWKNEDGTCGVFHGATPADAIKHWLGLPHAIESSGAVQLVNTGDKIAVTIGGVQIASGLYDDMLSIYRSVMK